jgi:uncharacterized protein YutE (UPF0331/DUF86 family)
MVDRDKIEGLIRHLRRYLTYLRELAPLTPTEFLTDPHAVGSARYYLTIAVEACLDIAGHIIASEGLRSPRDYKDTFRVLNEIGILPDDLTATMQSLAGLRNLLVHVYWDVDDAMLHESLRSELDDFEAFVAQVLAFLEQAEPPAQVHDSDELK